LVPKKPTTVTFDPFVAVTQTPAGHSLRQRLEKGSSFSCPATTPAAQSFFTALLRQQYPQRPIVVVAPGLNAQETLQQDVTTWLEFHFGQSNHSKPDPAQGELPESEQRGPRSPTIPPLFYPAWETLPHDARLPHADVISERLETLVTLSHWTTRSQTTAEHPAPLVVTSVNALLQRTFHPESIRTRMRSLERGDTIDPLDLVEWLEDQGYEPEVQVTRKGDLALRGGIVDIFPLTSPWPVRLEFFGDELESIRHFDPHTQISRETIDRIVIPPGGELGILKKALQHSVTPSGPQASHDADHSPPPATPDNTNAARPEQQLASLLDYLPQDAIFLLCEPAALEDQAVSYSDLIPENDPFFVEWPAFQKELMSAGFTVIGLADDSTSAENASVITSQQTTDKGSDRLPTFESLEAFRPILDRAPEPAVAEAQRREFFAQLHRWSRQGYIIHLFCNNDGERQRFEEIQLEYGFITPQPEAQSPPETRTKSNSASAQSGAGKSSPQTADNLDIHLGSLSRGFICHDAKFVTITDAEIFGRYKLQRPRRLKSPHAQTSHSLLEIDFTDLDSGDYVVHLQHGIGRYLGLQMMPVSGGSKTLEKASAALGAQRECLVLEYAASDPAQASPKLYVPVNEAHLVARRKRRPRPGS
jgi:transcription-repair coupling factor (superfamily II helicase)